MPRALFFLLTLAFLTGCATPIKDATNDQLIQAMHTRDQQAWSHWESGSNRIVTDNGFSGAEGREGVQYFDLTNKFAMNEAHKRIKNDPAAFFPILKSSDPEAVLTGLWIYHSWAFNDSETATSSLRNQVAQVLRRNCLTSPDARIRWKAMQILILMKTIDVADIDLGLSDRETALHDITYKSLYIARKSLADPGPAAQEFKYRLQGIAVKHLADEDWLVRAFAANYLSDSTTLKERSGLPKIDWVIPLIHADFKTRQEIKQAWAAWYAQQAPQHPQ